MGIPAITTHINLDLSFHINLDLSFHINLDLSLLCIVAILWWDAFHWWGDIIHKEEAPISTSNIQSYGI